MALLLGLSPHYEIFKFDGEREYANAKVLFVSCKSSFCKYSIERKKEEERGNAYKILKCCKAKFSFYGHESSFQRELRKVSAENVSWYGRGLKNEQFF